MKSLILALAILCGAATCEAADSFYFSNGQFSFGINTNPTFRPQPRSYGPPMSYRGDWVPYYYRPPYYWQPYRPPQSYHYPHHKPRSGHGHKRGHRH